jgi:CheY-like chemotaxis protein
VLVADDFADTAETLARLLSAAGCEVHTARDGQEAVERIRAWHPDVCVLDLSMPNLDGLDIAICVRREAASACPLLIALTGWGRREDRARVKEAGFDLYFVKPADPADILAAVQTCTAVG